MLAKSKRLPIKAKISKNTIFSTSFFTVKIGNNKEERSRFAFIAGKGVDKRAVRRNRIKRKFRNLIEKEYNKIEPGHDFLFRIKRYALEVDREELLKSIITILKKEKLIK